MMTYRLPRAQGQPKPGQMNKLEAAYAAHLDALRLAGDVSAWWYDVLNLRVAPGAATFYKPDFLVLRPSGALELHEAKGSWMRDDALIKLKVVAATYPLPVFVVRLVKREWQIEEV